MSFKLEYLCKIEFTFITNLRCEPGDQAGSLGEKKTEVKKSHASMPEKQKL
jgi:hypothetical protein